MVSVLRAVGTQDGRQVSRKEGSCDQVASSSAHNHVGEALRWFEGPGCVWKREKWGQLGLAGLHELRTGLGCVSCGGRSHRWERDSEPNGRAPGEQVRKTWRSREGSRLRLQGVPWFYWHPGRRKDVRHFDRKGEYFGRRTTQEFKGQWHVSDLWRTRRVWIVCK